MSGEVGVTPRQDCTSARVSMGKANASPARRPGPNRFGCPLPTLFIHWLKRHRDKIKVNAVECMHHRECSFGSLFRP